MFGEDSQDSTIPEDLMAAEPDQADLGDVEEQEDVVEDNGGSAKAAKRGGDQDNRAFKEELKALCEYGGDSQVSVTADKEQASSALTRKGRASLSSRRISKKSLTCWSNATRR